MRSISPVHGMPGALGIAAMGFLFLAGCASQLQTNLPFVPQSKYVNVGGRWLTRDEVQKYKSIRALSNATKVNPNDAMAFNTLGEMFQTDGNFDLAKELYVQALKLDEALSEAHHNLGRIALLEGNPDDALIHLGRALKLSPDDARIYHRIGQAHAAKGQYDQAMASFAQSIAKDDEYTPAYLDQAKVLYANRQYQQAEAACRAALAHQPRVVTEKAKEEEAGIWSIFMPKWNADAPPEPVTYQIHYNLALCLKAQGRLNDALAALLPAEATVKGNTDVQLLKARLLEGLNRNAEAIAVLEPLRAREPHVAEIPRRLARLYEGVGRKEDALRAKLNAADLDHSDRALQVEAAKAAIAAKDHLRIIAVFERLVRLDPKDVASIRVLADAYEQAGIKRQAALTYQSLVNLVPDDMDARRRLGMLYADLPGFQGRAVLQFKAVLDQNPRDGEIRRRLGELYLAARNINEAEKQIRWSLDLKPNDVQTLMALGDLYVEQKRGEEATKQYRRALELNADLPDAQLKLATTLRSLDRREEALEPLQKYLAQRPLDENARRMYAEILRDLNRREEAVQEYQALAALRPYDTQTSMELAKLTRLLGNLGDAAGMYEALLEKNPSNKDALRSCGRLYDETDQPLRAMYCWQRLLKLQANDLEAQGRLAAIYKSLGADEEAIDKYVTLGKTGDAEAWRNVAYLRLKRGERELACEAYRELIRLKKQDLPARMALVSLLQRQDSAAARDEALSVCQEAVAIDGNDLTARLNLANMLTEANRLADANEHYQFVLQKNPQHIGALVGLAVINRKRGRYKEALAHYEEALKHDPENRQLHYNLGLLYDYYLNRPEEAREHYRRFVALDGDPQLLPEELRPPPTPKPVLPRGASAHPDSPVQPQDKPGGKMAAKPTEKPPDKKPRPETPEEAPDDRQPNENLRAPMAP